jgi:hypothetical protein
MLAGVWSGLARLGVRVDKGHADILIFEPEKKTRLHPNLFIEGNKY